MMNLTRLEAQQLVRFVVENNDVASDLMNVANAWIKEFVGPEFGWGPTDDMTEEGANWYENAKLPDFSPNWSEGQPPLS